MASNAAGATGDVRRGDPVRGFVSVLVIPSKSDPEGSPGNGECQKPFHGSFGVIKALGSALTQVLSSDTFTGLSSPCARSIALLWFRCRNFRAAPLHPLKSS